MKYIKTLLLSLCVCFASCSQAKDKKEITGADVIKMLKNGGSVQIANKIIMDDLDFTQAVDPIMYSKTELEAVLQGNVCFVNCVFMGKITTNGTYQNLPVRTRATKNWVFTECDFRGPLDFNNLTVDGNVDFAKAKFRNTAQLNNMHIRSKQANFKEILTENTFSLIYSTFAGNLNLMDAQFTAPLSLQETTIQGMLNCSNMQCVASADFGMILVYNRAIFNYAHFGAEANFANAQFMHDLSMKPIVLNQALNTSEMRVQGTFNKEEQQPETND